MPPIRFFAFKRYTLLTTFIFFNKKMMSPYSRYIKKGLIYIIIISLFSCQPSFYFKYIKTNTRLLCDICLVFLNKYRFLHYIYYYTY